MGLLVLVWKIALGDTDSVVCPGLSHFGSGVGLNCGAPGPFYHIGIKGEPLLVAPYMSDLG